MIRKRLTVYVIYFILIATTGLAIDQAQLNGLLEDLSQGISQTAYSLEERENSAERTAYETVVAKTENSERELARLISGIETAEELKKAGETVKTFSDKDELHRHTAAVALGLLKQRASFLQITENVLDEDLKATVQDLNTADLERAGSSKKVLSASQKRLIMVQVPVAEAAIYLDDNKENRRVEALKALFNRHECRVLASAIDETGEKPQYNFYLSGKKFVLEALIRNFKGTEVVSDLKAFLVVTSGGFWGQSSVEISITPKRESPEKGSLAWYQAVLEKDPFKYLAENNYSQLSQLGKVEEVGGEKKLRLKNAKVDLWIVAGNGTKRDAVYRNHVEFGDVYVAAR